MKLVKKDDAILENVKHIHFIGIGGSGMCPLAEILHSKGYILTGSDNNESDPLKRIKNLGIKVSMGHSPENVEGAQLVVYSAAISKDNPELVKAAQLGIPTMERCDLLGIITRKFDNVIGVSGTHGKTTVSSMITQIFLMNDLDPTAVIGGRLPMINANGCAGNSENMVCEACEFVDTFLHLSPDKAVLLNIDNDHLDYFKTMDNLILSFHKFISMASKVYLNGDDPLCLKAAENIRADVITFGLDSSNDYYAENIHPGKMGMCFDIYSGKGKLGSLELSIPGKHNVYNALAAVSVADNSKIPFEGIKTAIESFTGAGRRFERLGEFDGITLVDDYAHHPTEIEATLSAAKKLNHKNIIAVFQPFTFSRTALLKDDFIKALSIADKVILTPIMGSREINTYGISSEDIAKELKDAVCVEDFKGVVQTIEKIAHNGDIVITMGGGDIYKAAYMYRDLKIK
ncbi:MAG: UDP-N-acetylmuramate--L-alanine ligase [Acutalibacteraceae bacterium]|nr:UDP-N-acetylmuramate--L-alanine ligase [Acutalibacteraceae bacterium]